jgi:hypothetical protein
MPVEILRQIPDDVKVELSTIVRRYKQRDQEWQEWAAAWHIPQENVIDSFPPDYLITLFERRSAETHSIPDSITLSLKDVIDGRWRAKEVYDKHDIRDSGRHTECIRRMEELYEFAISLQSASESESPNISKPEAVANDLGSLAISLQQDHDSDKPLIDNPTELSALPGLLMNEILKCLEEVGEGWKRFFRPERPGGNLVSMALGTSSH